MKRKKVEFRVLTLQRMPFLSVATFFSLRMVFCLSCYWHFRHVPCFHILWFKIWRQKRKSISSSYLPQSSESQTCFKTSARLLNDWFGSKWMCSLKCWISYSLNMDVDWVFWGYVMSVRFVFLIIPRKRVRRRL